MLRILKKGVVLTNYDLVKLVGTDKQISNYEKTKKIQKPTKDSLLKQLSTYCEYKEVKVGRSINYEIVSVYEMKREKEEKRGGNNSIYQDDFVNIMIYNLHNYPEKCKLLSKSYLSKMANLVNSNYLTCKRNIKHLSTILEINEDEVYSFYNDNQKKLASIVERGLNSCRRKSILTYNSVTVVVKKKAVIRRNELGEPIIRNNRMVYDIEHNHRIANEDELEAILNVEHTIKEKMFDNKNVDNKKIFLMGKWSEYKNAIKIELKARELNIDYYYEAYELNWIKSNISELYINIEKEYDISSNNINKNYINSVENTIESNSTKTRGIYKRDNYSENQLKLSKTLIDKNTEYLGNDDELRIKANIKKEKEKNK